MASKSDAIRAWITQHPECTASQCVSALKAQRVRITPNLFYQAKNAMVRGGAMPARASGALHGPTSTTIKKVKAFAGEVGGLRELKNVVDELL